MNSDKDKNSRRTCILRTAIPCDPDPAHSEHVARIALKIFDATASLHRLDSAARELLEYASFLHDIGWSMGEAKHKRHSYEMIKSAPLPGFSDAEKEIIASVARYHGVKPPREKHPWNQVLSPEDKKQVRYLSAIIRIADALDRGHRRAIEDVECTISPLPANSTSTPRSTGKDSAAPARRIVLKLRASCPPDTELWALDRKRSYFEELFQSRLETSLVERR